MTGLGPITHVFVNAKESRGWPGRAGHDTVWLVWGPHDDIGGPGFCTGRGNRRLPKP